MNRDIEGEGTEGVGEGKMEINRDTEGQGEVERLNEGDGRLRRERDKDRKKEKVKYVDCRRGGR